MALILCGILIIGVGLVISKTQIHHQQPTIENMPLIAVSAGFVIYFGMRLGRNMQGARYSEQKNRNL